MTKVTLYNFQKIMLQIKHRHVLLTKKGIQKMFIYAGKKSEQIENFMFVLLAYKVKRDYQLFVFTMLRTDDFYRLRVAIT